MKKLIVAALLLACDRAPVHAAAVHSPPPPHSQPPADPPPPLTLLSPADIPPTPTVAAVCPTSAPAAVTHHPGPCTMIAYKSGSWGWWFLRMKRTYNPAGTVVSEKYEKWQGSPNGSYDEYFDANTDWS